MSALLDLVARVVVLLLLAWFGTTMLRRRSAAVRASVWTVALAAVVLLPAIAALTPSWRVPVWDAVPVNPGAKAPELQSEPVNPGTEVPGLQTISVALNVTPKSDASLSSGPDVTTNPTIPGAPSRNWSLLLLAVISAGTFVLLLRIAMGHWRMHRIVRSSLNADGDWSELVNDVRAELGVARNVPVLRTGETSVPAVSGIWKPVLLLPIDTNDWPQTVRRAVVLHELAHVVRRDAIAQVIGQLACAIYWFVPLAWYGARRAAAFRERACDDLVLRAGMQPSTYAGSLVALAQTTTGMQSSATLAMAQPSRIPERVVAILNPVIKRERLTWRSAFTVLAVMCVATTVVGAIELTARETEPAISSVPDAIFERPAAPVSMPRTLKTSATLPLLPALPPVAVSELGQTADRICGGRALDRSSNSIHEDDNTRRWTMKLSAEGCSVDLRAEGKIEFNADFTDISQIGSGGFFRVDVTDRGVRRQLDIEARGGTLTRTWRVDGKEQPYDAAARTWFAGFLVELDRRTAIGVDTRLPHLIRQGGVDAVLKETAMMSSDYARSQYYQKLPAATKMSPAEMARVIRQAGTMTTSDHYASELVRAYASGVQDPAVRTAMIELVERMKSDHYQATSIETILGPGAPGQVEMDVMMRLVPKMDSDHYKAQVLMKVLKADSIGAAHRTAIAGAVSTISSDHYAAEVLTTLARKGLVDDSVRRAFFEAVAKVESDHYQGEVLNAFTSGASVNERDLLDAVASTKAINSDHYKSEALLRIARHRAATDRVRSAVLDAISGLSSHYAEQVRRAAGK